MRTRLLSPNKKRAIEYDDSSSSVSLLDLEHHITICHYRGYPLTAASWSPRGDCVAIGSPYKTVRVWNAITGELMAAHAGGPEPHQGLCRIVSIAWSPDGSSLAAASTDGTIQVGDALTGEMLGEMHLHRAQVVRLAWSPNNSTIASASIDGAVAVWEVRTGNALKQWDCPVQVDRLYWYAANLLVVESAGQRVQRVSF
jgi:WD40 repeat protein